MMEHAKEAGWVAVLANTTALARAMDCVAYRSCAPRYAKEVDLLSGEGSRRHGGRWNPVGLAMVYASLTPEAAMAEALAHYRYFGIPIENAMPRVFVAISVQLTRVVDLRIASVRRALGIRVSEFAAIDWRREVAVGRVPGTQALGRAADAAGIEGLVVPSAVSKGHNLLVLPGRLATGNSLRIHGLDRLSP
jgi:RES domain-containing protein